MMPISQCLLLLGVLPPISIFLRFCSELQPMLISAFRCHQQNYAPIMRR